MGYDSGIELRLAIFAEPVMRNGIDVSVGWKVLFSHFLASVLRVLTHLCQLVVTAHRLIRLVLAWVYSVVEIRDLRRSRIVIVTLYLAVLLRVVQAFMLLVSGF